MFNGTGTASATIVLSDAQLNALKNGFIVQDINKQGYNITGVTWSKTPDYFTINLAVNIDGVDNSSDPDKAKVTASDRGTWYQSVAYGQSVYPVLCVHNDRLQCNPCRGQSA